MANKDPLLLGLTIIRKVNFVELHPICLPVGLPVSVSYRPSSVGIFGMVLVLSKV
jgi:hypothetical protein